MVAHWRQTDRKYANCTVPLLVDRNTVGIQVADNVPVPKVEPFLSRIHGNAVAYPGTQGAEIKAKISLVGRTGTRIPDGRVYATKV